MAATSRRRKNVLRAVTSVCAVVFLAPLPGLAEGSADSPQMLLEEGLVHAANGDRTSALARFEAALVRSDEIRDQRTRALGLYLRSMLTADRSNVEETLASCSESLAILERLGDDFGGWMVRLSRAEVLRLMGRQNDAWTAAQEALEALERVERSGGTIPLDTFRIVSGYWGAPPELLAQVDAFLPLLQPLYLRMAKAATVMDMAAIQRDRQEYEEALATLERALWLSPALGSMDALILKEMASLKRTLGREDEAAADETKALERAAQPPGSPDTPRFQQDLLDFLIADGAFERRDETAIEP